MSVLIFNQTYAIEFHPTDFSGFKTTPLSLGLMWKYKWENIQKFKKVLFFGYNFCYHKSTSVLISVVFIFCHLEKKFVTVNRRNFYQKGI